MTLVHYRDGATVYRTANASLVMRCLLETEAADRRREVSTVKKDLSGGKDIPIAVYVGRGGRKGS